MSKTTNDLLRETGDATSVGACAADGLDFRLALDQIPGLVWTAAPDGYIEYLNLRWCEYTGLPMEQASGWGWQSAVCPADLPALLQTWRGVLASGQAGEAIARLRRHDGVLRWFLFRAVPLRDDAGRLLRWYGQTTDIEERKQAETRLEQSEERYALAMAAIGSGHWDWLPCEARLYASPRLLSMCGLPASAAFVDWQHFSASLPIHADDREQWDSAVRNHMSGRLAEFKLEIRTHVDGSIHWFEFRGLASCRADGQLERWTGSVADVTGRRRAELNLRESQERFSLAVEGSHDGIWDWDVVSNKMFLSQRAQKLYGITVGPNLRDFDDWAALIKLHPDDEVRHCRQLNDYLAGRAAMFDCEFRSRHLDGHYHWLHVRGVCVRDGSGRATRMAGSVSDIDARKRAEAALQRSQRLDAIGILAGGIAHDFNNILGSILGFSEIALRRTRKGSQVRVDLECIVSQVDRGRALVGRILAFSRTGGGKKCMVHIEGIVHEWLNILSATAPASIRIQSSMSSGRASVIGDPTQIHQVLMNIGSNALHAMGSIGELRIEISRQFRNHQHNVTTGRVEPGEYVVLQVRDTGHGIAPDIRDRIFDPFVTTKDVGAGTGLGLSLVHGIVTEMGGAIDVDSEVGQGSCFTIYLPCSGDAGSSNIVKLPELPRGRHQQVLIVDDEEALVHITTKTLGDLGYVPVGFTSSSEALAAFRAHPDRFDAIITDESMPGLTGTSLIRAVRALRQTVPVILVSGYLGGTVAINAEAAGASCVLNKPLSQRELAEALAKVIS
ncbi:PAS domain-containing sensor histidine kinase [Aquincola sp. J276]|uniref:PAS domain-containing hybrid sensor histidine kinase/response regulator n=1 Tax=Aquincola sp. J276 TaxID=2898432 RepID=UPI0021516EBA|nr:PAS domain-containing sensor histidine kinase [Aquincola sp. J276]MCR5868184.1 PAS domain-containing protein [Aquincola sp. J276]